MKWSHRKNHLHLPPVDHRLALGLLIAGAWAAPLSGAAPTRHTEKTSPPAAAARASAASSSLSGAVLPEDITFLDKVSAALARVARVTKPSVVSIQTTTPQPRARRTRVRQRHHL